MSSKQYLKALEESIANGEKVLEEMKKKLASPSSKITEEEEGKMVQMLLDHIAQLKNEKEGLLKKNADK